MVLPGSTWAEDEGVVGSFEARVIKWNRAVDPPGEARVAWQILCELARRLGRGQFFQFNSPREIFDELRVASRGGRADYYGMTYERIEEERGISWPCPSLDHPGTPRMFEDFRFYHPDGRARFFAVEPRPPAEHRYPYHTLQFPYQRALDSYVTRRDYLRLLVLTSFGLFAGTAGIAAWAQLPRRYAEPLRIATVDQVPEGQALQFNYPTPRDPAILVHLPGGGFVAYSQLCTHLACAVLWGARRQVFDCPCHEGLFDAATGRVLAGPPPRPLPSIRILISDGTIYAMEEALG